MSKWIVLCTMAGVAGFALAAGDASAAPAKRTVAHNVRPHPTKLAHTQQRFHNAGTRQHNTKLRTTQQRFHNTGTRQHTNKLANTQQRFHKTGATTHPTGLTHLAHGTNAVTHKPLEHGLLKVGPSKIGQLGPKHFPTVKVGNKVGPIFKTGPKRIWVGGRWKIFVALATIPVVRWGGGYYWPDAYVNVARPYCTGATADGCQVNWQPVNFEDGGRAFQCVQFCPRPGAPPPAQAVALTPPPAAPAAPAAGACELTIYSEANFTGQDATTGEEQPTLSQTGWGGQIVSVQVKSGVWDFFAEENFTGNNMRLQPGAYQDLGPEWAKKINSFNCVMPAAPGATATSQ